MKKLFPDVIWATEDKRWISPEVGQPWCAIGIPYYKKNNEYIIMKKDHVFKILDCLKEYTSWKEEPADFGYRYALGKNSLQILINYLNDNINEQTP